jgi:hypothetical protein
MSEDTTQSDKAKASSVHTEQKPARPRRSWKRRLLRFGLFVLVAALVVRLGLAVLLGFVVRNVASFYGLDITFRSQELALLAGDVGLWDIVIKRSGEPDDIVRVDYVRGNISTLALLQGRLKVSRAEIDGAKINLHRLPDGSIPLLEDILFVLDANTPKAKAPAEKSLDLTSPLEVDAFRLSRASVTILDETVSPQFSTTLHAAARVSDLRRDDNLPTRVEADLWADAFLDVVRINGTGNSIGRKINFEATVAGRGLDLSALSGYLAPLGLEPVRFDALRGLDFNASLELETDAAAEPDALRGALRLHSISAADAQGEAVGLDEFKLTFDSLSTESAQIDRITLNGARVSTRRTDTGRFRFAGVEFVEPKRSVSAATTPSAESATDANAPTVPASNVSTAAAAETSVASLAPEPFDISLKSFELGEITFSFEDLSLPGDPKIDITVTRIRSIEVKTDADGRRVIDFDADIKSPGLTELAAVQGLISPFDLPARLDARFSATGIKPTALAGYLKPLGLEPRFEQGTLNGLLNATVDLPATGGALLDLDLTDLRVVDGPDSLGLRAVSIRNLLAHPSANSYRLGSLDLRGPDLTLRREPDGALSTLGLRFDPNAIATGPAEPSPNLPADQTDDQTDDQSTNTPATGSSVALPRIQIDHLRWSGARLRFEDQALSTARSFDLKDAIVELKSLVIDLDSDEPLTTPGTLTASFSLPGVIDQLTLDGTFTPSRGALDAGITLRGRGINLSSIPEYFKPLGVEPLLASADLSTEARATLRSVDNAIRLSVDADNIALIERLQNDQGETSILASVRKFSVDQIDYDGSALRANIIRIEAPFLSAGIDHDGGLRLPGLRLPPPPEGVVRDGPPLPAIVLPALPLQISVDELTISDARLDLRDDANGHNGNPIRTTLYADLAVTDFLSPPHRNAQDVAPAKYLLNLRIDDTLGSADLRGSMRWTDNAIELDFIASADRITLNTLAGYLPPEIAIDLSSGSLTSTGKIRLTQLAGDAATIRVDVGPTRLIDAEQTLLSVSSASLHLDRYDPAAPSLHFSRIHADGLAFDAAIVEHRALQVLGLSFDPSKAQPAPEPQDTPLAVTDSAGVDDSTARIARARRSLPLLKIDQLDLGIDRIALSDRSRPESAPLALTSSRLTSAGPIELAGPKPTENPPLELSFKGEIAPLVGSAAVGVYVTPFASSPEVKLDLNLTGVRGSGLTDLVPELRPHIDGSPLIEGSLIAQLTGTLELDRRNPTDLNLARGFGANLHIEPLHYRSRVDGPIELGVDRIDIESLKVRPAFAGASIKGVTIAVPRLDIERRKDGLHAFGWRVPLPDIGATSPSTESPAAVPEPSPVAEPEAQTEVVNATPASSMPEFRIDRLIVRGVDVSVRDMSVEPNVIVPINLLDVEVRGLSTLALVEPRAIRLSALVQAGEVPLRKRDRQLPAADRPIEARPLFSQISASGRMVLFPSLDGYLKANISGAEVSAFKGLANELAGISLEEGLFDGRFDARFSDGGNLDLRTRLVLTDLKLAEPANGPIGRLLKLPAPIDAVIGAIEDPSGSITLPVTIPVRAGEVNVGGVVASAVGAIGQVVTTAFVSAPLKLLGIGGGPGPGDPEPVLISHDAGDPTVSNADVMKLAALADLMKRDRNLEVTIRHQIGSDDEAIMSRRANPDSQTIQQLIVRLRGERDRLRIEHRALSARRTADLAIASSDADVRSTESALRLLAVSERLAAIDVELEAALELTRPGASTQAQRRTRAGLLELAAARVDRVRMRLSQAGIENADVRIQAPPPNLTEMTDGPGVTTVTGITKRRAD